MDTIDRSINVSILQRNSTVYTFTRVMVVAMCRGFSSAIYLYNWLVE